MAGIMLCTWHIYSFDAYNHQQGALLSPHFTDKEMKAAKHWDVFTGNISLSRQTRKSHFVGFKLQTCSG